MTTLKELTAAMKHQDEREIIEALREYYDNDEEYLQAIKDDDDITDKISEWADTEVDIYTHRVYEWIGENPQVVSEYEEQAISEMGANTVEKIGQMCQYMHAEANAREALDSARKVLEEAETEAV